MYLWQYFLCIFLLDNGCDCHSSDHKYGRRLSISPHNNIVRHQLKKGDILW